jgi:uncharacterized NAD(P)/FAD-binding protein YdhS
VPSDVSKILKAVDVVVELRTEHHQSQIALLSKTGKNIVAKPRIVTKFKGKAVIRQK